ncbi:MULTISPECIES: hypothetical protein [Bradyrhizobium]|uniref:hypothetical protein n=1 Tax=Bradyrhizobium TaxID=374 RepID=UPI00271507AC|nr:hypothetical protein [Bradyrhizobium elkanii]WLA46668.1 hypothetical protein QIH80_33720 [Bradyrhizobium elkanii]WLB83046.1 hypothetical protein QIH83_11005 [Bradyrhizobium elkanii]
MQHLPSAVVREASRGGDRLNRFADKFTYIGTRERLAMEETFEAKGAIAYAEAWHNCLTP